MKACTECTGCSNSLPDLVVQVACASTAALLCQGLPPFHATCIDPTFNHPIYHAPAHPQDGTQQRLQTQHLRTNVGSAGTNVRSCHPAIQRSEEISKRLFLVHCINNHTWHQLARAYLRVLSACRGGGANLEWPAKMRSSPSRGMAVRHVRQMG